MTSGLPIYLKMQLIPHSWVQYAVFLPSQILVTTVLKTHSYSALLKTTPETNLQVMAQGMWQKVTFLTVLS
jgi:hypothetical protein